MKYRTTKYSIEIGKHKVIKESKKMITYMRESSFVLDNGTGPLYEFKEHKDCENQKWFDTFEEARSFLFNRASDRCEKAKNIMKQEKENCSILFKLEDKQ